MDFLQTCYEYLKHEVQKYGGDAGKTMEELDKTMQLEKIKNMHQLTKKLSGNPNWR